jgi:hypothetical protein
MGAESSTMNFYDQCEFANVDVKDRESHEIKRSGRVLSIEGSFDSNQEKHPQAYLRYSCFRDEGWDVACHDVTSCDVE